VSESLEIPTIGIGAGAHVDGQVLVTHDMLGLFERFKPKFAKRYAALSKVLREAFREYADDVRERRFPCEEHSFEMDETELRSLVSDGNLVNHTN
jgi:3-methyl-2-oxobutanoate hydroxymethyltransferase